jgi:acylglycerol lipase
MPPLEDSFLSHDGTRLFERRWLPEADVRGVVAMVHGFTEHSGRYATLAAELNQRGYAVFALDLRGHGRSEGPRCFVRSFDEYLADLDIFLARVCRQAPDRPLFLFGHSMGGLMVALYAITRQPHLQGLVLSGAALKAGDRVFPVLRRLAGVVGWLLPRLRVVRMGFGYFSRDPQAVAAFRNDPLVFHDRFPARTGAEMLRAMRLVSLRMEEVRVPLLILHGTGDIPCDCQAAKELYCRAASSDKTLRLYDGLYHALLWEPEREMVLADLAAWLDARSKP